MERRKIYDGVDNNGSNKFKFEPHLPLSISGPGCPIFNIIKNGSGYPVEMIRERAGIAGQDCLVTCEENYGLNGNPSFDCTDTSPGGTEDDATYSDHIMSLKCLFLVCPLPPVPGTHSTFETVLIFALFIS